MARGGARARSGPAPDPSALRRDRATDGEWITLPAEGRKGKGPKWPIAPADPIFADRESALWARLWKLPQAVQWEALGMHEAVALYVRRHCEAEVPGATPALTTIVRQLGDALGLSPTAMRALRWRVGEVESAEVRALPGRASARDRLKVLSDGAR